MDCDRVLPEFKYNLNPIENGIIVRKQQYVLVVMKKQNLYTKDHSILLKM